MNELRSFIYEEDGLETIEVAIILAAVVALAIVFKKQLGQIWDNVSKSIMKNKDKMGEGEITDDGSDTFKVAK